VGLGLELHPSFLFPLTFFFLVAGRMRPSHVVGGLLLLLLAAVAPFTAAQVLCNLCTDAKGCCTAVISSASGKASCMIDTTFGISLDLDDHNGGMSFTLTLHGGVCFAVPAIGKVSYASGGDAKTRVFTHRGGPWGDEFTLLALQSGGYSICWGGSCCIVTGSSGSCENFEQRTLGLTNVGSGTSDCPFGSLRMTWWGGQYAQACLDRRPSTGSDYMLYWHFDVCDVIEDKVSAVCKPWTEMKPQHEKKPLSAGVVAGIVIAVAAVVMAVVMAAVWGYVRSKREDTSPWREPLLGSEKA
jgi:hypothetical protein